MDSPITRAEYQEYKESMKAEHKRLHFRITDVEKKSDVILDLTRNVERLAANMGAMMEEQKEQGHRLEILESRDGESWRKVKWYVLTVILGILIGYFFNQIGM